MAPVTEIASLPAIVGFNPEDTSSPAADEWRGVIDTISNQDGFQSSYYGRQFESPQVIQLLVDWDSVDAHKAFMKSPGYKPFLKHLGPMLDGEPQIFHVHFAPHPPSGATSAPVTELATFHFSSKLASAQQTAFDEAFHSFRETAEKSADGLKGVTGGWAVEDLEYNGEKGKAFVAAFGWDSVDAHMAYRETDAFKESITQLREKATGVEMHHATFNQFEGTADTAPIGAETTFTSKKVVSLPRN